MLTEALGICLLLAFAFFVWPPLALAGAGIALITYANTRGDDRGAPPRGDAP